MGFIVPVKRIVAKLPKVRQTLLFSATMPQTVAGLADSLLKDPVRVEVTPVATTAERISQRVHFVEKANKRALLEHLLGDQSIARALVFTRTKHGANKVADQLGKAGVRADAIHGNKSQNARQKALNDFRNGKVRVLVATDIAARGIDVDGITHVVNFDLPNEPESYVHRIGRTARAGNDGIAISFCDSEERAFLRDIERTIRQQVTVDADHPFHAAHIVDGHKPAAVRQAGRNGTGSKPAQDRAASRTNRHHDARPRDDERRSHHGQRSDRPARPASERDGQSRGHHAHSPKPNEHRHQDGRRHEQLDGLHGNRPHGQKARGKHHAGQGKGGHQPLKRSNSHQGGAKPQRFEPVRMG